MNINIQNQKQANRLFIIIASVVIILASIFAFVIFAPSSPSNNSNTTSSQVANAFLPDEIRGKLPIETADFTFDVVDGKMIFTSKDYSMEKLTDAAYYYIYDNNILPQIPIILKTSEGKTKEFDFVKYHEEYIQLNEKLQNLIKQDPQNNVYIDDLLEPQE